MERALPFLARRCSMPEVPTGTGELPFDVLFHIATYVRSPQDKATASLVCKAWCKAFRDTVSEVTLCNCCPVNYPDLYERITVITVCEPALAAHIGEDFPILNLLRQLPRVQHLRRLDLTGLDALKTPEHVQRVSSLLHRLGSMLTTLQQIHLPRTATEEWNFSWIASLPDLRCLMANAFSVKAAQLIPHLSKLTRLDTIQQRVTRDSILNQLASLTQLRDVEFAFGKPRNRPSSFALATFLSGMTNVTRLIFSFAQSFTMHEAAAVALGALTGLKTLHINSFYVLVMPPDGLEPLSQLQQLEELELSGMNHVQRRLHAFLPKLRALKTLTMALTFPSNWEALFPPNLESLELTNVGEQADVMCPVTCIATLTRLTCLHFKCCSRMDDAYLQKLGGLQRLVEVNLSATNVAGQAFSMLHWPNLQVLIIGRRLHSKHLGHLSAALPGLRELRMDHCKNVTTLSGLHLVRLTKLRLNKCGFVGDRGLLALSHCLQLQNLDISWDSGYTHTGRGDMPSGSGLAALSRLSHLTELSIQGAAWKYVDMGHVYSFFGLMDRFMGLPPYLELRNLPLASVSFAHCKQLDDKCLSPLSSLRSSLLSLDLQGCSALHGSGLAALQPLSRLHTLDLSGCTGLQDVAIHALTNSLVNVRRHQGVAVAVKALAGPGTFVACAWSYLKATLEVFAPLLFLQMLRPMACMTDLGTRSFTPEPLIPPSRARPPLQHAASRATNTPSTTSRRAPPNNTAHAPMPMPSGQQNARQLDQQPHHMLALPRLPEAHHPHPLVPHLQQPAAASALHAAPMDITPANRPEHTSLQHGSTSADQPTVSASSSGLSAPAAASLYSDNSTHPLDQAADFPKPNGDGPRSGSNGPSRFGSRAHLHLSSAYRCTNPDSAVLHGSPNIFDRARSTSPFVAAAIAAPGLMHAPPLACASPEASATSTEIAFLADAQSRAAPLPMSSTEPRGATSAHAFDARDSLSMNNAAYCSNESAMSQVSLSALDAPDSSQHGGHTDAIASQQSSARAVPLPALGIASSIIGGPSQSGQSITDALSNNAQLSAGGASQSFCSEDGVGGSARLPAQPDEKLGRDPSLLGGTRSFAGVAQQAAVELTAAPSTRAPWHPAPGTGAPTQLKAGEPGNEASCSGAVCSVGAAAQESRCNEHIHALTRDMAGMRIAEQEPMPALKHLSLSLAHRHAHSAGSSSQLEGDGNNISTSTLTLLGKLPCLETLDLEGRTMDVPTIKSLATQLTRLKTLNLNYCISIRGELQSQQQCMLEAGRSTSLQELSMRGCVPHSRTLAALRQDLPHLAIWHDT